MVPKEGTLVVLIICVPEKAAGREKFNTNVLFLKF